MRYKSGNVNVDMNTLYHILWEDYDQHLDADTVWTLISNVTQATTLIEVYSCNMQVTETSDMQTDSKTMLWKDWIIVQSQDPVVKEIKYLISKK